MIVLLRLDPLCTLETVDCPCPCTLALIQLRDHLRLVVQIAILILLATSIAMILDIATILNDAMWKADVQTIMIGRHISLNH